MKKFFAGMIIAAVIIAGCGGTSANDVIKDTKVEIPECEVVQAELKEPEATPEPTPVPTEEPTPEPTPEPQIEEDVIIEVAAVEDEPEEVIIEETQVYEEPVYEDPTMIDMGIFNVTFYCPCPSCCNSWIGAAGVTLTEGYSIALPGYEYLGHTFYVEGANGYGGYYVCQDVSPAGICDLFIGDHNRIPSWGMTQAKVYMVD